jgi:two-component system sensor histidine kinase DegS
MTNPATTEPTAPATLSELSERMAEEAVRLDKELGEVELLIAQARAEATRHETRRAAAAEKVTAATAGPPGEAAPDTVELNAQLVLQTKRAALMESQVEVLEGKQRALTRFRESLARYAEALDAIPEGAGEAASGGAVKRGRKSGSTAGAEDADTIGSLPPAVSRLLLGAQEDMRREIARAMHDGPAQSLTNIVLQAQIVERLVGKDPARASSEVHQLVAMVQQTLEATKTFIFDVRPMVLDDLGLVPTLRRAARDRGRRAGIAVEFESLGQDRRVPMDLESGLFRILDEALAGYLEARAERVSLKVDWTADQLDAVMSATRAVAAPAAAPDVPPDPKSAKDLPPALAAMMEDRRADARTAAEAAQRDAIVSLPPTTWREVQGRAATLGLTVELSTDGAEFRLLAELPPASPES